MYKAWRASLIFVFFVILWVGIVYRLAFLQIVEGDKYRAWSQGFHNYYPPNVERGRILLENGEPLAINADFPLVFASPKKIRDIDKVASSLGEALGLDMEFVADKLKKDTSYALIKRRLSDEEVSRLKNLNLEGVSLGAARERYYPQGDFAAQILGFMGAEGSGQYGLEEYFNEALYEGSDLVLTIDYNVQFEAEKLLNRAQGDLDIEGGQIVVIEPASGKVIAIADFPSFDPNFYQKTAQEGKLEVFKNKASQEPYEPGSIFKPITMASAIEEGRVDPKTTYVDKGIVNIGNRSVYNYDRRVYGEQTMTGVLEKSINTGAVFAEQKLGNKKFLEYIDEFGIFEPSDIDIPEVNSENREFKKGYEINFATAAFGQGIEMTPIQLVKAYTAIANGGKMMKPYVVEKILNGGKETEIQPYAVRQVISQKTSSQVTAMMVSVVENGFGKAAKVPGYYIAGKTGTAQIAFSALGINKPGYSDKTAQSFVGFGPAFDPRFLILVKLDNPKSKTAEYSALPIFRDLAEYIINYWQIKPDYE